MRLITPKLRAFVEMDGKNVSVSVLYPYDVSRVCLVKYVVLNMLKRWTREENRNDVSLGISVGDVSVYESLNLHLCVRKFPRTCPLQFPDVSSTSLISSLLPRVV